MSDSELHWSLQVCPVSDATRLLQECALAVPSWNLWEQAELEQAELHSSKLTWKWRGTLNMITSLYMGPSMSFYVNLGEGILFNPVGEL